ncbi:23S rRNA pseudouridylate synthase [Corynebacterium sp. HMSC067D03]|nr:23S rRNA pseudouridylate synthase [Corynebacterium sp. HMSC067D03]
MRANLLHTMARKKGPPAMPLPPRGGLGASRARVPEGDGIRAIDFIWHLVSTQRHRHPEDNFSAVQQRFDDSLVVHRDTTPITPEDWLEPGTDVFFYRRPAPERPVPYDIVPVFEDDNILVVDKPPFLATMPRASHITETATVRLRRATGNEELTPAHRLDRGTSGLLLLTKRREVRGAYQELFARREVDKMYEAIAPYVALSVPADWSHHLVKVAGEAAGSVLVGEEPNSHTEVASVTRLPAEQEQGLQSLYGVTVPLARYVLHPTTGRTHQLRLQMMTEAAPILGDTIYPTLLPADAEDFSRPMRLRCIGLGFVDPLTGEDRSFALN